MLGLLWFIGSPILESRGKNVVVPSPTIHMFKELAHGFCTGLFCVFVSK